MDGTSVRSDPFSSAIHSVEQWVERYGDALQHAGLEEILEQTQRRANVRLTDGALLLLIIPLLEQFQAAKELNDESAVPDLVQFADSMVKIIDDLEEEMAAPDRVYAAQMKGRGIEADQRRSALSIIREFWRRFCNIPPLCGEADDE